MSNLSLKKKKGTGQWKRDKEEKKRNLNIVEHSILKKRKEKNEHFF